MTTYDVVNPADESVVATVGLTSAEETDAAVTRARVGVRHLAARGAR